MGMRVRHGLGLEPSILPADGRMGLERPVLQPVLGWGGVGPYYGWEAPVGGCYQPIVYCGNTSYQHRPGLMGGAGAPGTTGQQRSGRDPAGLMRTTQAERFGPTLGSRSIGPYELLPGLRWNGIPGPRPCLPPVLAAGAVPVGPTFPGTNERWLQALHGWWRLPAFHGWTPALTA